MLKMGKAHKLRYMRRLFGTSIIVFVNFYICIIFLFGVYVVLSEKLNTVLDKRKQSKVFEFQKLYENCSDSMKSCSKTTQPSYDGFIVKAVLNNYIVQYDGYYEKCDRLQYLQEALNLSEISVSQWGVLPHNGVANLYPSDFDVLQVDFKINAKVWKR